MDDNVILPAQDLVDRFEQEYRSGTHSGGVDMPPHNNCAYPSIEYKPDLWPRLEPLTLPDQPLHTGFNFVPSDFSRSEKNLCKDFFRHTRRLPTPEDLSAIQQLFLKYREKHLANPACKGADPCKPLRADYICRTAVRAIAELNSKKYNWLRERVPVEQIPNLLPFWLTGPHDET